MEWTTVGSNLTRWLLLPDMAKPHIVQLPRTEAATPLCVDIIGGLQKPRGQRTLPTILLYDEQGLRLYDDITTKVPEYYLFPAEEQILRDHGREIVRLMHGGERVQDGEVVLELGAGCGPRYIPSICPDISAHSVHFERLRTFSDRWLTTSMKLTRRMRFHTWPWIWNFLSSNARWAPSHKPISAPAWMGGSLLVGSVAPMMMELSISVEADSSNNVRRLLSTASPRLTIPSALRISV